jgi:hypothetical protein
VAGLDLFQSLDHAEAVELLRAHAGDFVLVRFSNEHDDLWPSAVLSGTPLERATKLAEAGLALSTLAELIANDPA